MGAVPGVNETASIGGIYAGIGIILQWTNQETVYDLYGKSSCFGASGGPL